MAAYICVMSLHERGATRGGACRPRRKLAENIRAGGNGGRIILEVTGRRHGVQSLSSRVQWGGALISVLWRPFWLQKEKETRGILGRCRETANISALQILEIRRAVATLTGHLLPVPPHTPSGGCHSFALPLPVPSSPHVNNRFWNAFPCSTTVRGAASSRGSRAELVCHLVAGRGKRPERHAEGREQAS